VSLLTRAAAFPEPAAAGRGWSLSISRPRLFRFEHLLGENQLPRAVGLEPAPRGLKTAALTPRPTPRAGCPSPIAGGRAREVGVAVSLLRPASLRTPQDGQQNKTQTSGYREHELHHVCPLRCNFPRCILNGTIRPRSRAPPTAM